MEREHLLKSDYDYMEVLRKKLDKRHMERLLKINDQELHRWLSDIVIWAEPNSVYIVKGDEEDFSYIKEVALNNGEELKTKYEKHTVHFDGPKDLARDRHNTKILIEQDNKIPLINTMERNKGLMEIRNIMKGIMKGKEMYVGFFCLGPKGSPYAPLAVQVTDSSYVMHNELILYRSCYEEFINMPPDTNYFRFLHSTGERNELGWAKNIEKKRIYIDLKDETAYTTNSQYGGNTIGLKKLAFRLTINRGLIEGWLSEHMFIVGVKGTGERITYFTGAFPAGCGKTSTALMADTIIGDDLALIREVKGVPRAINPEIGMFGIIDGINPIDDPKIYKILVSPIYDIIFSNVLLEDDGTVWWYGKPKEPKNGINYAGRWFPGKKDEEGNEIKPSHPNARFTTRLSYLDHLDPRVNDPEGVPIGGMIFGGRDSDTQVPVEESFDWDHGVVTKGAALESEMTAAVLGKSGVREFNPYAILEFLSISVGKFTQLHFDFGKKLKRKPKIFGVNYFLKGSDGNFLSEKTDKKVWLKWMELRVYDEIGFLKSPTGRIPLYQDLEKLFNKEIGKEYKTEVYEKQFTIRIPEHLDKIERIWSTYEKISDTPQQLFKILKEEKDRLILYRDRFGNYISPFKLDRL
ncbi:MAG: phosphoenolpyruvate carboxykinase (GTP) [Caldisphaera sp.]|jgi:phosphoenolpyruvate carboxykinase (GTP)